MDEQARKSPPPPRTITQEQKQKIVERLRERGVVRPCPMCGKGSWVLADGYLNEALHGNLAYALFLGGPSLPSAAIICTNCGFMSQHALGALGLLGEADGRDGA